jgi:hypothetical protein
VLSIEEELARRATEPVPVAAPPTLPPGKHLDDEADRVREIRANACMDAILIRDGIPEGLAMYPVAGNGAGFPQEGWEAEQLLRIGGIEAPQHAGGARGPGFNRGIHGALGRCLVPVQSIAGRGCAARVYDSASIFNTQPPAQM